MNKTPSQMQTHYSKRAMQCYELYRMLTEKYAEEKQVYRVIREFEKSKMLADLFFDINRRNGIANG